MWFNKDRSWNKNIVTRVWEHDIIFVTLWNTEQTLGPTVKLFVLCVLWHRPWQVVDGLIESLKAPDGGTGERQC